MIRNAILYGLAGISISALGQAAFAEASEYVYVETNVSPTNSIRAFQRGANGRLSEIPGSPFATGGAGSGYSGVAVGPDDSDQEIVENASHTLLFAINPGSDSIAVMSIASNGSLAPIAGSPFSSGGNDPVSLDIAGNLLFVANKAGDPNRPTTILPSYNTLVINNDGSLQAANSNSNDTAHGFNSTVSVAAGASLEQVHAIPGTNLVFGDDLLSDLIEHFRSDWTSGLHQLAPLALPASLFSDTVTPRIPQGIWNHPKLPYLYVGIPLSNLLAVYVYDRLGNLTFLRAVPNEGGAICWLRTNKAGTRLYVTETITNTVGVYDITDPENPVQMQDFALSGVGNAFQLSLSSNGANLYVLSPRANPAIPLGQANVLHTLTIGDDGKVAETLPAIPFSSSTNARPRGIAVVSVR